MITYTAYYTDGTSKTTVQTEVQMYVSEQADELALYVGTYKLGKESLNYIDHILLSGILATEVWREDISGKILVDGEECPALQINLNTAKEGASSYTITFDTEFSLGSTYFAAGETYEGDFSSNGRFFFNTENKTAINVTLKVFDVNNTKLAEQTTVITIRDRIHQQTMSAEKSLHAYIIPKKERGSVPKHLPGLFESCDRRKLLSRQKFDAGPAAGRKMGILGF